MRISCASFVRIRSAEGRLGLIANKNQLMQGRYLLAPVGGAMEVPANVGRDIMKQFGMTPTNFDKPPTEKRLELRFTIDDRHIDDIRRVFLKWSDGGRRELFEELIDETGILTGEELQADGFSLTFAHTAEDIDVSSRTGRAAGQMIHRFIAVYDLSYGARTQRKLIEAATRQLIFFVTPDEIRARRTINGLPIAPISSTLITPTRR